MSEQNWHPINQMSAGIGKSVQVRGKAMTALATAIEGMKHWDWCPICRGGLDTGLECDQCGADLMPIYTAFKESLSGSNPGEPKACTPAEERGIVGATGAGQLPDGKPGSTVDSAERRSPDDTTGPSSPDESNRHLSSKSTVWMAKNRAYSETCYFGNYATAVAWAKGGAVIPVEVRERAPPDLLIVEGSAPHEPQGWQPIETAPHMRKIIVHYLNALGKGRTVMACYYEKNSLELHDDYEEAGTYDDATGMTWADEGWYEEHDSDNPIMTLGGVPTHWMPLPSAPSTKSGS